MGLTKLILAKWYSWKFYSNLFEVRGLWYVLNLMMWLLSIPYRIIGKACSSKHAKMCTGKKMNKQKQQEQKICATWMLTIGDCELRSLLIKRVSMILCVVFCPSQPVEDTIASIVTFYPSYAICLNIDQRASISVDESCHHRSAWVVFTNVLMWFLGYH